MELDTSSCMCACCIFVACASPPPLRSKSTPLRQVPKSSLRSPAFNPVQSPKPRGNTRMPPHPRDGSRLTDYCSDTMPSSL